MPGDAAPGASVVLHIASTREIGSLTADRMALAVRRSPRAFLGMATGSTPKTTGFRHDCNARCQHLGDPSGRLGLRLRKRKHGEGAHTYHEQQDGAHSTCAAAAPVQAVWLLWRSSR